MQATSSIHWNSYPALLASGALAAGITVARHSDIPVPIWMVAVAIGIVGAAGSYRRPLISGTGALVGWLALALFSAGALRYADDAEPPSADVSHVQTAGDIRLVGRPSAAATTSSGVRFVLDVDSAFVHGRMLPLTGRVQVYVRGLTQTDVDPCRNVSMEGRLSGLPEPRNPEDFNYAAYLRGHHIFSRMFAESLVPQLPTGENPASANRSRWFDASCVAHRLKTVIEGRFERSIRDDAARAIILALVVGDRTAIDVETADRFRRTGLLHLLAVSGLHVLIVGMILYHLLRPIFLRMGFSWLAAEWGRTVLTAIVLVLYALVTGLPASVVRAAIMAILFMIGTTFQRSSHSLNTLGVAGLFLLVARPAQLFEPGFQLSVAAVAAIITLEPRFSSVLEGPTDETLFVQTVRSSTSVSMAAAAGTLPVLLYHFGSVSFAGLFLNTVAVPLTSATLASSVTTAAAAGISDVLGVTFGHASQFFAQFLLYVVERGEPYFRWAYLESRVEDAPVIAAIVTALVMVVQWPRSRLRWRLCAVVLSLLIVDLACDAVEGEWRARLDVIFFDVGQGDAALITFPNGRTLLLDTGPRTTHLDAGRYTILPHLQRRQIRRLDAVVITHPDSDHLGGLPTLLRHVAVGRVLHSGRSHESALYTETTHLIDSLNIPYQPLRTGDTLLADPSVRIHVLHPEGPRFDADPNASSVVLHVRYGHSTLLFLGDAERDEERDIVRRYGDAAAAHVIKIGHHGSATSSTGLLLSRVIQSNTIAVVSAGARNRFGHPDSAVVRRLRSHGAAIHRTDQQGAVRIGSDGRRSIVHPWR